MSGADRPNIVSESALRWVEELRPLSMMNRLGLVLIATLVLFADGTAPSWILALLAGFVLLFLFSSWRDLGGRTSLPNVWSFWLMSLATLLVVRNTEHNELLLLLVVQPILNCTFLYGARSGMALAGFMAAGLLLGLDPPGLVLQNALPALGLLLLPPVGLLSSRPMAALRQRMELVDQLQREQDPRRGLPSVGLNTAEALRNATGAQRVVVCHRDAERPTVLVSDDDDGSYQASGHVAERLLQSLDGLPVEPMALDLRRPGTDALACDDATIDRPAATARMRDLAELLGAGRLQLAPDLPGHAQSGWVLVAHAAPDGQGGPAGQRTSPWPLRTLAAFATDMRMLLQQASYVDVLQAEIAAHERERIGRDLHDSALQPYLGLKFAIESLAMNCPPGNAMHGQVQALRQFCETELAELRETVSALRSGQTRGENTLVPALRRQARRYAVLFGIQTELQLPEQLPTNRVLSGAVLHMVNEALNNVRRHTQARQVWISLTAAPDRLHLVVRDDAGQRSGKPAPDFEPRSLIERARELGGSLQVRRHQGLDTEVHIAVPI